MLMKKPRHRVFDYPPRFYKPDEDVQVQRKKRLGFTSYRKFRNKRKSPIIWIILILLVLYLIFRFGH